MQSFECHGHLVVVVWVMYLGKYGLYLYGGGIGNDILIRVAIIGVNCKVGDGYTWANKLPLLQLWNLLCVK